MTFISVFGMAVFLVSLLPHFDKPKYLILKGIMFLILGISAGAAMVHIGFFP